MGKCCGDDDTITRVGQSVHCRREISRTARVLQRMTDMESWDAVKVSFDMSRCQVMRELLRQKVVLDSGWVISFNT